MDRLCLDDDAWLAALGDAATQVVFPPGRQAFYHRRETWRRQLYQLSEQVCYVVLSGRIDVELDVQRFTLGPGCFWWLQPDVQQSKTIHAGTRLRYCCVSCLRDGRQLVWRRPSLVVRDARESRVLLEQLVHEARHPGFQHQARCRSLMLGMAVAALREQHSGCRQVFAGEQRQALHRHVDGHVGMNPTPADCARLLGYSPAHFARLFRCSFGCSARQWLVRRRLDRGAQLLHESDEPIATISEALGYRSPFLFSRQFQAHFACSPSVWRSRR
ncbi:MAG: helix-turn-helix domain-containing protein [Planctomycetota bacterium]